MLDISAHEVKVNVLFVHLDICVLKIHQYMCWRNVQLNWSQQLYVT
jgi:hypothetical protein